MLGGAAPANHSLTLNKREISPPTLELSRRLSEISRRTSFPSRLTVDDNHAHHPLDNRSPLTVAMGRLHSKGKGISASAVPYSRNAPSWLKTTPEQVVDQICKLAKKGATPSQIGVVLRDSHGIAQVKLVTGMRLSRGMRDRISNRLDKVLTITQETAFSVSSRAMV